MIGDTELIQLVTFDPRDFVGDFRLNSKTVFLLRHQRFSILKILDDDFNQIVMHVFTKLEGLPQLMAIRVVLVHQ